jgi:hypothetical protein
MDEKSRLSPEMVRRGSFYSGDMADKCRDAAFRSWEHMVTDAPKERKHCRVAAKANLALYNQGSNGRIEALSVSAGALEGELGLCCATLTV